MSSSDTWLRSTKLNRTNTFFALVCAAATGQANAQSRMPVIKNLAFAPLRSFICLATPIADQERTAMIKRRLGVIGIRLLGRSIYRLSPSGECGAFPGPVGTTRRLT